MIHGVVGSVWGKSTSPRLFWAVDRQSACMCCSMLDSWNGSLRVSIIHKAVVFGKTNDLETFDLDMPSTTLPCTLVLDHNFSKVLSCKRWIIILAC